jgi:hypothetical protein
MRGIYRKIEPGTVFNRLTVLDEMPTRDKNGRIILRCTCSCGKITEAPKGYVISGNTKSCGCAKADSTRINMQVRWLPKGEAAFNALFNKYRIAARERGYEFLLTKDEFRSLTALPCNYCGLPPSQVTNYNPKDTPGNGNYIYSGVDRVDNGKGYSKENCVPCCKTCQYAKRDNSVDDFLQWAARLAAYQAGLVTVR